MKTIIHAHGTTYQTNPGPAGFGYTMRYEGFGTEVIYDHGGPVSDIPSNHTVNFAQYFAVVEALEEWALSYMDQEHLEVEVRTDSDLVVAAYHDAFWERKYTRQLKHLMFITEIIIRGGGQPRIKWITAAQNETAINLARAGAAAAAMLQ